MYLTSLAKPKESRVRWNNKENRKLYKRVSHSVLEKHQSQALKFGPSIFLRCINSKIYNGHCRNGIFGSQGLDIRNGLGTKLKTPVHQYATRLSTAAKVYLLGCTNALMSIIPRENAFARRDDQYQSHKMSIWLGPT